MRIINRVVIGISIIVASPEGPTTRPVWSASISLHSMVPALTRLRTEMLEIYARTLEALSQRRSFTSALPAECARRRPWKRLQRQTAPIALAAGPGGCIYNFEAELNYAFA